MQGGENIPAHRQVTKDPWGHVLNGMMDTMIKPVASGTYVLTVEGHIQEQSVLWELIESEKTSNWAA